MKASAMIAPTRNGFALPTAILLLLCMTAGVVTAFTLVSGEVRVIDNQRAETAAFAMAEAGLQRYLARGLTTPTDTTMVLSGGTARVRSSLVYPFGVSDTSLYLIRSDGVVAGGAGIPQGRRTVAQYAYQIRARMRPKATWTSLGGLTKSGSSGVITGGDACGGDSIAGAHVPDGSYSYSGGILGELLFGPLAGSPPLLEGGTLEQMASEVKIDWAGLTNPTLAAGNYDVIVCYPGTVGYDSRWGPCSAFPSKTTFSNTTYWPTILVNGSVRLPNNGRGMLLATGNLILGGNDNWEGVILVGNQLTDLGSGTISGAVFSGMNALTGAAVDPSQANGTKNYVYNSCNVARAAVRQSRYHQIPNAWTDNWATW
jgi:hypothetical protein